MLGVIVWEFKNRKAIHMEMEKQKSGKQVQCDRLCRVPPCLYTCFITGLSLVIASFLEQIIDLNPFRMLGERSKILLESLGL